MVEASGTPVLLDPALVTLPVQLRFRASQSFTGPDFERLKRSIAHLGRNVQPIKVRPGDAGQHDLVFGSRRLQACRELGLPVTSVVESMTGPCLVAELDASNDDNQVSVYERGCLYEAALNAGYFPSRRRLAEALGLSLQDVIGATTIAQLPRDFLVSLPDPRVLKVGVAKRLAATAAADPEGFARRLAAARLNNSTRISDLVKALTP